MSALRETIASVVRLAGPMESQERLIDDLVSALAAQPVQQPAPVDMPRDGQHLQPLPRALYVHHALGEMWDRFAMHSYAVRHMPELSSAAPVAAPVDVPAASVQPEPDKMECVYCHSSKRAGRANCPECGHDRFAQRPLKFPATTPAPQQPDSGRDAALVAALENILSAFEHRSPHSYSEFLS